MIDTNTAARPTQQFYWLSVLLFLSIALLACRLFGFNGLYGQDSHEYLRYAKAIKLYLNGGSDAGNFFWPVVYPFVGALLSFIVPIKISLQVVSIFSAAVCYVYFGKSLNLLYPEGTQRQRFAFVCLLCSPFFLRASILAMSDMLCCAILSAFYFHIIKAEKYHNKNALIIAVILAILVIQVRYASIILLLPIIPILIKNIRKHHEISLTILAAIILSLSPSFFLRPEINTGFLHHPWLTNWSPMNLFKQNFNNLDSTLHYTFPNVVYVLALFVHPGFCFFLPIMCYYLRKKIPDISPWWYASILVYLIFLGGIPFQNLRFLLLVFPLILLIIYPGFELAFYHLKNRSARLFLLLGIFIIQAGFAYRAIRPFYRFQQEEISISKTLNELPTSTVYTFAIDGALRSYEVKHEIINIWSMKDAPLTSGSLFLYNPTRFKGQFRNTPPGIIYTNLIQQNKLNYIKPLQNGWQLYKIK